LRWWELVKIVADVMRRNVEWINPTENLRVASTILGEKHIGSLVVMGSVGPIGLLTETDIIWKVIALNRDLSTTLALEVMSISFGRIGADASLKEAAKTMLEKKKRLLVFEGDRLIGIVTATDLVKGIAEADLAVGVEGVMSKKIFCLDENATALEAAQMMADKRIGSVIVTRDDEPYGIFAERDIITKVAARNLPFTTQLKFLLSTPLITALVNTTISEAAKIMVEKGIKRLPLLQGEDFVGIVTARDLVEAYAKTQ
jgi:CBS domain-containing protein